MLFFSPCSILSFLNTFCTRYVMYITGCNNRTVPLQRSSSLSKPPPPPVRRTSSISSNSQQHDEENNNNQQQQRLMEDDEKTPRGSAENISDAKSLESMAAQASSMAESLRLMTVNNSPGILRRSSSMSNGGSGNFDPSNANRRSLTFGQNKVTFAPNAKVQDGSYNRVSTHHVIPVGVSEKPSPEAEIYGFGAKFRENSRQYFSNGNSDVRVQAESDDNQRFVDSLSKRMNAAGSTATDQHQQQKSRLKAELERSAANLKKTNGPRF